MQTINDTHQQNQELKADIKTAVHTIKEVLTGIGIYKNGVVGTPSFGKISKLLLNQAALQQQFAHLKEVLTPLINKYENL